MKIKYLSIVLVLLLFSILSLQSFSVFLSSSTEEIDTARLCSLILHCEKDGTAYADQEIAIYHYAGIEKDLKISLTGEFAGYPFEVNGIQTQSEWSAITSTVGPYIIADGLTPFTVGKTDEKGTVRFDSLPVGFYYITMTDAASSYLYFEPFTAYVPGLNTQGGWDYEAEVHPKMVKKTGPVPETMTVTKLWRDSADRSRRPEKIEIWLYHNGTFAERIFLSGANNWTYSWETDDKSSWTAVERHVPEDYTVLINEVGSKIYITNSGIENSEVPPKTQDVFRNDFLMLGMSALGLILLFAGRRRGGRHAE
ncbi:MAG: Cna B-type domain-containing protein [Clostridia bacterium]|nr:Cna B-type domain-containing protein [Clostridia bacterium]